MEYMKHHLKIKTTKGNLTKIIEPKKDYSPILFFTKTKICHLEIARFFFCTGELNLQLQIAPCFTCLKGKMAEEEGCGEQGDFQEGPERSVSKL